MTMPTPPPDTRAPGQTGHIADHNTIADALTALDAAVATLENTIDGVGISLPAGDLGGTPAVPLVLKIQGTPVNPSPGGTTAFLRADGTWDTPPGTGGGGGGGGGGGSGTVTSVSGETANGFVVSVNEETTTPEITVATSISGVLKGSGGALVAAVAGTDYLGPTGNGSQLTGLTASQVAGAVPSVSPTFSGVVAMAGASEVTVPAPANPSDAATKSYVDATAQGLSVKPSAHAATTGAETYVITSGAVAQIGGTSVDGVSPSVGDYILVKDAPAASGAGSPGSSQPANGLYQVTGNSSNLALTRAAAMSGSELPSGAFVFIEAGTANGSAGFVVSTPSSNAGFAYGTGAVQWSQFSNAGAVTAGTGLSKSGSVVSLSVPVSAANGGTGASSAPVNEVFAGPASGGSGAPSFRALAPADVPTLNQSTTGSSASCTGNAATATNLAGAATFPARIVPKVFTLTDGSSVAVNAALGNIARWPLAGASHTLAAPTSPADGQPLDIRIVYGGAYTPLFNATWDFTPLGGAPSWTATSGKVDEVGFRYNADAAAGAGAWVCVGWVLGA